MLTKQLSFGHDIQLSIQITETFIERNRGLLALDELMEGQGLLITPCRSVHTFGMSYALDLIYLNKGLKIVKIVENILVNRMSFALFAHSTLELKSGEVQRLGIKVAMQASYEN